MKNFLMFVVFQSVQANQLISCQNVSSKKVQLCYQSQDYEKSQPSKPWPQSYYQELVIFDILDFDPKDQTMTASLKMRTEWNDTRLMLKSGNPDE